MLKAVVVVGAYCVGIMKSKQVSLLLSFLIYTNKFALTNNIAKIYLHGVTGNLVWGFLLKRTREKFPYGATTFSFDMK